MCTYTLMKGKATKCILIIISIFNRVIHVGNRVAAMIMNPFTKAAFVKQEKKKTKERKASVGKPGCGL